MPCMQGCGCVTYTHPREKTGLSDCFSFCPLANQTLHLGWQQNPFAQLQKGPDEGSGMGSFKYPAQIQAHS